MRYKSILAYLQNKQNNIVVCLMRWKRFKFSFIEKKKKNKNKNKRREYFNDFWFAQVITQLKLNTLMIVVAFVQGDKVFSLFDG